MGIYHSAKTVWGNKAMKHDNWKSLDKNAVNGKVYFKPFLVYPLCRIIQSLAQSTDENSHGRTGGVLFWGEGK